MVSELVVLHLVIQYAGIGTVHWLGVGEGGGGFDNNNNDCTRRVPFHLKYARSP